MKSLIYDLRIRTNGHLNNYLVLQQNFRVKQFSLSEFDLGSSSNLSTIKL